MDNPEEISIIIDRSDLCLLLSGVHCRLEEHKEYLNSFNVGMVVDMSNTKDLYKDDSIDYLIFDVKDTTQQELCPIFVAVHDAILHRSREYGSQVRVLVHCQHGISRSASVVLYLLMKFESMSLKDAFRHLKSRRRIILPNSGFMRQLIDVEESL